MSISLPYTANDAEIPTGANFMANFNQIINNPVDLWSPAAKAADMNGQELILDADADSSITADTDDQIDFKSGGIDVLSILEFGRYRFTPAAQSGTPGTSTGGYLNIAAATFTDNATAGSGTATAFAAHAIQRPTLAASNTSVTTTDAASLYIANSPAAGTNETLTRAHALWIDDGNLRLDGQMVGAGAVIVNELRLTLTTATPVTTGDVTAATTLYLTPYKGTHISIYDGAQWQTFSTAEISIAVPATTSTMYDVFAQISSGAPALVVTAWTNDTTRATALAYQNGVYVKSGTATQRYIGSFRTTGSSGQTEDSVAKRYVWNYNNRVLRSMKVTEATNSWTYSTAGFRQANGAAANQLDYVQGVSEDVIEASVIGLPSTDTAAYGNITVGIGVDSSTTNSATVINAASAQVVNQMYHVGATYQGFPGVGRHTLVWLEYGAGAGTQTWHGDNGDATLDQAGIWGRIWG